MAAKDEVPAQLVITLRKPVKLGDLEYSVLHLREPTAGELLEVDREKGWAQREMKIALVSGVPQPVLKLVGVRDMNRAHAYLARFSEIPEDELVATGDEIPDALDIKLIKAVEADDGLLHSLALHEPTSGEMYKLDKFTGWKADCEAIALISGKPLATVLKLGERDARRASRYLGHFFGDAPSTGANV